MRRLVIPLGLALALLAGSAAAGEGGRLRGEVRAPDRRPIPGASIAAVRSAAPAAVGLTVTDTAGLLSLDGLPAGSYSVAAAAEGFTNGSITGIDVGGPFRAVSDLTLQPGEAAPVRLTLPEADGPVRLSVRVSDPEGKPLAGVEIRAEPAGHRADPETTRTGPDGRAGLDRLAVGDWRIVIHRAGWTRMQIARLGLPGGAVDLVVRLLPLSEAIPAPIDDVLPAPRLLPPS